MVTENSIKECIEAQLKFERMFSTITNRVKVVAKRIYAEHKDIISSRFTATHFNLESIDEKTFVVGWESIFRGDVDDFGYLLFPNQLLYDDEYIDIYIYYLKESERMVHEAEKMKKEIEAEEVRKIQYEISKKFIKEYEAQSES